MLSTIVSFNEECKKLGITITGDLESVTNTLVFYKGKEIHRISLRSIRRFKSFKDVLLLIKNKIKIIDMEKLKNENK